MDWSDLMLDWLLMTMFFMFSCPCRIDPGKSKTKELDQQATPSLITITPSSKNLSKCVGIFTPGIESSNWILSNNIVNIFWYCANTSNLDPNLCRQRLQWVEPLTCNFPRTYMKLWLRGGSHIVQILLFSFWWTGAFATCLLGTTSNLARRFEALEQVCDELYTFILLLALRLMMLDLSWQLACINSGRAHGWEFSISVCSYK